MSVILLPVAGRSRLVVPVPLGHGAGDHTRFPVARLRFTQYSGLWTLSWRDRNQRFHLHEDADPTPSVQDLLTLLDEGVDPIFWG